MAGEDIQKLILQMQEQATAATKATASAADQLQKRGVQLAKRLDESGAQITQSNELMHKALTAHRIIQKTATEEIQRVGKDAAGAASAVATTRLDASNARAERVLEAADKMAQGSAGWPPVAWHSR